MTLHSRIKTVPLFFGVQLYINIIMGDDEGNRDANILDMRLNSCTRFRLRSSSSIYWEKLHPLACFAGGGGLQKNDTDSNFYLQNGIFTNDIWFISWKPLLLIIFSNSRKTYGFWVYHREMKSPWCMHNL